MSEFWSNGCTHDFRLRRAVFLRLLLLLALLAGFFAPVNAQIGDKVAVLWIDPLRNIREVSTRRGILNILTKAKASGFEAVAFGVKTISGHVLYRSKTAPRLLEWEQFRLPLDFDPIQLFLEESHRRGLQFYAVYPVFSEGHMLQRVGPVYDDHSDWQASVYVVENETPQIMPITQWAQGPVAFANPLNRDVQNYEVSMVAEFLQNYSVDGIILDKLRFSGLESDFSDESRRQFETFLGGQKVDWWPEDIFEWQFLNEAWQPVPGQLFTQWVEFRSQTIQSFVNRITMAIQAMDPTLPIGNFVGSWYPTYYEYGVNWASETNVPEENWATSEYNKTAIAEKFSYSVVGCFFPRVTMEDTERVGADWWMSVEGGAITATEVINKVTPVYAAILVEQFKDAPEKLKAAMTMARKLTDGLHLADVSQIEKYKYWDEIKSILISGASESSDKRSTRTE